MTQKNINPAPQAFFGGAGAVDFRLAIADAGLCTDREAQDLDYQTPAELAALVYAEELATLVPFIKEMRSKS